MSIVRQREHLAEVARRHPNCWRQIEEWRSSAAIRKDPWPEWCYWPFFMADIMRMLRARDDEKVKGPRPSFVSPGENYTLVQKDRGFDEDVYLLCALSAWRCTQGIYRFDPDLLDELWESGFDGMIPVEQLYRLPEWCCYLETPGRMIGTRPLHGFYVHLDFKAQSTQLRLLLDIGDEPVPRPLPLRILDDVTKSIEDCLGNRVNELSRDELEVIKPLVSLALYLCYEEEDIQDAKGSSRLPHNPSPKRVKGGERLFPAAAPSQWNVGFRLGAKLRAARSQERQEAEGSHARPRAHVRRAHWHTYWTGSKGDPGQPQKRRLNWLHPLLVNAPDSESLVPVVRPVTSY